LCSEFEFINPSNRSYLKAVLTGEETGVVRMTMMKMDSNRLLYHIGQDFSILMYGWQGVISPQFIEYGNCPFFLYREEKFDNDHNRDVWSSEVRLGCGWR
jgi:hypothetical protein